MFKELIVALVCVVAFNSAARVPHGEPTKKQVSYSGYNVPAPYQDPSQYHSAAYPQSQFGVVGQGQIPQTVSGSAGTTGVSLKQSIVPQKSAVYPVPNSVSTQYGYPFKQYYPQIYPQNSQYPSVPSVFYVPSQGRFPSAANEGAVSNEGTSSGSGASNQGGYPPWFGANNWNVPSYWPSSSPQAPQVPQAPQIPAYPQQPGSGSAGSGYPFPSVPTYPSNFPSIPQFPNAFPSQFPSFPSNFPAFPGNSPANSVPAGASPTTVPGSEAVAGTTTNNEGHSVVVVSARKPEKIENSDSNIEGLKNEVDKVATDFPPQQYYLVGQPQYFVPNAGQVPVAHGTGGKDPSVHLDGAAKGAVSSFLFQQQPILSQTPSAQPVSQITQNKLYTPQEFQELVQQVQVANKKLIESNGGNVVPQFYVQQGAPQQGVTQQSVNSQVVPQSQSQDVPSQNVQGIIPQQVQGLIPQQYIFQGAQPVAQVQQPYFQFPVQQQQFFVPPYSSLSQKPVIGEVSNVPGAALAYQRFLLENQKPIKSSFVGVQSGDGTAPISGAGPTQVSVPSSVSSSIPANDSTSSPEPSNNVENDLTGTNAGSKN